MRELLSLLTIGAVVTLAGCTGTPEIALSPTQADPTSAAPTPTPSPSPSVTLPDASEFPITFLVARPLINGGAAPVIAQLHQVAQGLPVLKVDITRDEARLTALTPTGGVVSYAWRSGQITQVDSDLQYLGQATFNPSDYPLDNVARMFDVADLRGVRGTTLSLQIVEYRAGEVLMTVTSRPETSTVFFRKDGTAVPLLGITSVADITAGLADVIGDSATAYSVGFSPARGYWADLPDTEEGVILTRSRTGGLPTFETRRSETSALTPFDPTLIQPAALAQAISATPDSAETGCEVVIDRSLERSGPVAKITCADQVRYFDMDGRDMTTLVG